ncbi:nucleotidyltransferase family protein [Burkholderia diffusa]|uniref:nucleotidyltransferase family protein n=1 Tax=Burkholderia diffusa TaxID=488732 RepID=UPI0009C11903|nr:nucleotidyltransferase family protein [Burkholderia diffusa]
MNTNHGETALLLAAGLGTRLAPLTNHVPKCLAPIAGRPLLAYWLDSLACAGFKRIVINTHYLSDRVHAYVRDLGNALCVELVHEPVLLGTAGTVWHQRELFERAPVLVAHADNLTNVDLRALMHAHEARPTDCVMTMLTFEAPDPSACGMLEVDAQGIVRSFQEKPVNPHGTRANGAVYVFGQEVVQLIGQLGVPPLDLSTQVIPQLIGRIATYHHEGLHRDIGTPQAWRAAQYEWPARQGSCGALTDVHQLGLVRKGMRQTGCGRN